MSAQVDVMAALRDDFVDASLTRMHDEDAASKARRSEDALAAVAELIAEKEQLQRWIAHLEAFIGRSALPTLHASFAESRPPGGASVRAQEVQS